MNGPTRERARNLASVLARQRADAERAAEACRRAAARDRVARRSDAFNRHKAAQHDEWAANLTQRIAALTREST